MQTHKSIGREQKLTGRIQLPLLGGSLCALVEDAHETESKLYLQYLFLPHKIRRDWTDIVKSI